MRSEIKEVASHLKGRAYREFMTGVSSADMEKLGRTLAKKPVLGSEDFVEKIRSKLETEKGKAAEITEAKVRESRAFRQLVIAGGVIVGILGVAALSLFVRAIIMKKNIKEDIAKKDVEIIEKVAEEKQKIRRDLDEKYRADMVSYQALSKRLELEKARARELEAELKDTKGEFKHK